MNPAVFCFKKESSRFKRKLYVQIPFLRAGLYKSLSSKDHCFFLFFFIFYISHISHVSLEISLKLQQSQAEVPPCLDNIYGSTFLQKHLRTVSRMALRISLTRQQYTTGLTQEFINTKVVHTSRAKRSNNEKSPIDKMSTVQT